MTQVTNIINSTFPKRIMTAPDQVKGMYSNGRQVLVSYDKGMDLFNVWAFTLRGTKFSKEIKLNGIYIDQLKNTVLEVI